MGRKIRVLANPTQRQVVYSAAVYDDVDASALDDWTCGHNHTDIKGAYTCALAWIERSAAKGKGNSARKLKPMSA